MVTASVLYAYLNKDKNKQDIRASKALILQVQELSFCGMSCNVAIRWPLFSAFQPTDHENLWQTPPVREYKRISKEGENSKACPLFFTSVCLPVPASCYQTYSQLEAVITANNEHRLTPLGGVKRYFLSQGGRTDELVSCLLKLHRLQFVATRSLMLVWCVRAEIAIFNRARLAVPSRQTKQPTHRCLLLLHFFFFFF